MGWVAGAAGAAARRRGRRRQPRTPSTRASGSRRPSARTRARCGRGCIRLGARGSSSATGGPGHDDGPVLALELRDWAPRRRPCRAAALRARQLPQLYRVAPPCGPLQLRVALRHAPAQRVEGVPVAELEPRAPKRMQPRPQRARVLAEGRLEAEARVLGVPGAAAAAVRAAEQLLQLPPPPIPSHGIVELLS